MRVPEAYLIQHKALSELVSLIQKSGFELLVLFIRNEFGIITTVSVLRSKAHGIFAFGSSCKLDIRLSIEGSILESLMIARTQTILSKHRDKPIRAEKLIGHVMIPIIKKYDKEFEFLKMIEVVDLSMIEIFTKKHPTTLDKLISKLRFNGFSVYFADVTPKILRKSGYIIGKVIIPGLHPLESDNKHIHGDLRRISKFTGKMLTMSDIPTTPHPFG